MYEARWYDCVGAYRVLVMDPATSGVTWEEVEVLINAGGELPETVYRKRWGYEDGHDPAAIDPVAQEAHIAMCKRETLLLAAQALAPQSPPTVTLHS